MRLINDLFRICNMTFNGRRVVIHRVVSMCIVLLVMAIAGCQSQITDRDKLKAEILTEVMGDVYKQLAAYGVSGEDIQKTRDKLKLEIEDDILKKLQMLAPEMQLAGSNNSNTLSTMSIDTDSIGIVEGYILRRGKGLPNCRVKLVRMVETETIMKLLNVFREGTEFIAVTDENGKYSFESVPVGNYKLKWQLPEDSGWIRRLRNEPDVTVEAGETHQLKEIETRRRLAPS